MTRPPDERLRQFKLARTLFWVSFAAAVLVSTLLGREADADLAPAVGASTVMLLYLAASRIWTPDVMRHGDFADGFYYLGFLLTLVALVSTLLKLGTVEQDNLQRVVLARFGLALSTTIVGLVVRIALRMFEDREPDEALDVIGLAQDRLQDALEGLRLVLQNATTDMETTLGAATTRIGASVGDVVGRLGGLAKSVDEVAVELAPLSDNFGSAGKQAAAFAEELQSSSDTLVERIDAVGAAFSGLNDPVEAASRRLTTFATAMSGATAAGERLGQIGDSVTESFEALRQLVVRLDGLSEVGDSFRQLSDAVSSGQRKIHEFVRSVGEVDAALGQLKAISESLDLTAFAKLSETVQRQYGLLGSSLADWEKALRRLSDLTEKLGDRQEDAGKALLDVRSEISSGVSYLISYLKKIASRGGT